MASLFDRLFTRNAIAPEAVRWQRWLMGDGAPDPSGMVVSERTAMGIAAYFACRRNISEDVAKQPVKLSRVLGNGSSKAIPKHDLLPVLNRRPNPKMTAIAFWEAMMAQTLTNHAGFAEIVRERGGTGNAIQLWPLDPARMDILDQDENGPLVYEYRQHRSETKRRLAARDVFHIHGVGDNGITAWVATKAGKITLGRVLASSTHASAFFGNSAILSGILEVPPNLKPEAVKNLAASWRDRYSGPQKSYKTAILTDGVKFNPISTDPEKSQLVQAIYQGIEEVCRFFRMPPNKIQHLLRSTYSNISEENRAYATDTLQPWTERLAQEIQAKLLGRDENDIEVYFDDSMFLEADPVKRTEVRMKQFQMGMHTIDDLLIEAGKEPVGGEIGEARFVMSNVTPISKALAPPAPPPTAQIGPQDAPVDDDEAEDMEDTEDATETPQESKAAIDSAFRVVFGGHFDRLLRANEQRAIDAKKRGKLVDFQSEYRKKAMGFVVDGLRDTVTAYLIAHGATPNGQIDPVLNRIAAEYINYSSDYLAAVCAGSPSDRQHTGNLISTFAIQACKEGLSNET